MPEKLTHRDSDVLGALLENDALFVGKIREWLFELAQKMFQMFTQDGFPPDMFLDLLEKKYEITRPEKLFILNHYLYLMVEHKHKSDIGPKRLDALRFHNIQTIRNFLKTGEAGVY